MQGYVHGRRGLAALLAPAAIFVAGCGSSAGSGSTAPINAGTRTYLTSMCTAVGPVITDFGNFHTSLGAARSSDLTKYRQNVELLLTAMAEHASQAVAGLEKAGRPDIPQGSAIAHGVIAEYTAFRSGLIAAQSSAKAIPTINTHQFQLAFGGLIATLGTSLGSAGKTVNALGARLKAPNLAGAEKSVPACARIAR